MFGYRLVRESDWTELRAEVTALRSEVAALTTRAAAAEAHGALQSKDTMIDMLTTRLNALEMENAHARHAETGRPAVAATVGIGSPIRSEQMGATADLWNDTGDENARRLKDLDLLDEGNTEGAPIFESAAASTEFLGKES